jgi:hypothetical protein
MKLRLTPPEIAMATIALTPLLGTRSKADAYTPSTKWLKIKNPRYSQAEGRGELFNPPRRAI